MPQGSGTWHSFPSSRRPSSSRPAIHPLRALRLPFLFVVLTGVGYAAVYALAPPEVGPVETPALRWMLAVVLAAVGVLAVRLVRFFVLDVVFLRTQGHRAPALVHIIVALVLYFVLGLAIAGGVFGQSLTGAIATSAVASVVLGLALQETLGNFFAGVALQIGSPFRTGDVIRLGEHEGRVASFNWRATTVVTPDDARIVLPNALVAGEPIEVFARARPARRRLAVPAPYEVAPQRIVGVIQRAIVGVPGVAERPTPQVRVAAFGDSSLDYEVLYWAEDYLRVAHTDALVRERVWYAFSRNDISIPFPHEVEVPYEPPSASTQDPVEERARWLGEASLLELLTAEERHRLAERSRTLLFSPGETLLRAGDPGGSMFVLYRGRVEIRVPAPSGGLVRVAEIAPGEVIGEMSLLTGEDRSADAVALSEVGVVEVRRAEMKSLLDANAALAEALAREESERLAQRADAFARAEARSRGTTTPASILQRIRRFFDLDGASRPR